MNQEWLFSATACEWEEISLLKADYYTRAKGYSQYCVLTFDNPHKNLKPRYFAPKNSKAVRDPNYFAEILNSKQKLIDQMPWVQIDLEDIPPLEVIKTFELGTAKLSLAPTGNIKMRKLTSSNGQIININNLKNISVEAQTVFRNILGERVTKANLDFSTNTFSFENELIGKESTISITTKYENANTISITGEHLGTTFHQIILGWKLLGEFGYKLAGELHLNNPNSNTPITNKDQISGTAIFAAEAKPILERIALRVIFVLEDIALAALAL